MNTPSTSRNTLRILDLTNVVLAFCFKMSYTAEKNIYFKWKMVENKYFRCRCHGKKYSEPNFCRKKYSHELPSSRPP